MSPQPPPDVDVGIPTRETPPVVSRDEIARAWTLSLAWGWVALATMAGLAIAFGWRSGRDALDLSQLLSR